MIRGRAAKHSGYCDDIQTRVMVAVRKCSVVSKEVEHTGFGESVCFVFQRSPLEKDDFQKQSVVAHMN